MNANPRQSRSYHHGDLKQALLVEAERILASEGIQALTLRAVTRAAGVTHAAAFNHFGDLTGLLSELAAEGFRRLQAALSAAIDAAEDQPRARSLAMGRAYLSFAQAHRGLFTLMFRSERLDAQRPALREAMTLVRQALQSIVAEKRSSANLDPTELAARGAAMWSLAHGYATLTLDGRLRATVASFPQAPDAEAFFEKVMNAIRLA